MLSRSQRLVHQMQLRSRQLEAAGERRQFLVASNVVSSFARQLQEATGQFRHLQSQYLKSAQWQDSWDCLVIMNTNYSMVTIFCNSRSRITIPRG